MLRKDQRIPFFPDLSHFCKISLKLKVLSPTNMSQAVAEGHCKYKDYASEMFLMNYIQQGSHQ